MLTKIWAWWPKIYAPGLRVPLRGSYDLEDLEAKMVFFKTKTLKNHNSKTINGRKVSFVAFESL